jgi:hypothetical protein
MNEDLLKIAAEGAGAALFDMLRQGGKHVVDALHSEPVLNAGATIGEGIGRIHGALKGMGDHIPVSKDDLDVLWGLSKSQGKSLLSGGLVENSGRVGKDIGRRYAPHAAGGLAALGTGYALKKLLFDKEQKKNENPEIYIDRSGYPNYY